MPETVRRDPLRDACTFREAFHGSVGGVAVHSLSVGSEEDRPGGALINVEIERPAGSWGQGMVTCLPPLRTIAIVVEADDPSGILSDLRQ